jgi:hypothetical protein
VDSPQPGNATSRHPHFGSTESHQRTVNGCADTRGAPAPGVALWPTTGCFGARLAAPRHVDSGVAPAVSAVDDGHESPLSTTTDALRSEASLVDATSSTRGSPRMARRGHTPAVSAHVGEQGHDRSRPSIPEPARTRRSTSPGSAGHPRRRLFTASRGGAGRAETSSCSWAVPGPPRREPGHRSRRRPSWPLRRATAGRTPGAGMDVPTVAQSRDRLGTGLRVGQVSRVGHVTP